MEDDEDEEDIDDEEDLDIGTENDLDPPPWDIYEPDLDEDDSTEDTALLRIKARTEIIVTPISPVSHSILISHKCLHG